MADNKRGRDKKAQDRDRRQREREVEEELDRGDEAEPPEADHAAERDDLDAALAEVDYPTTTEELVETYGDYWVETEDGWETLAAVLARTENEQFDYAEDVRRRIDRVLNRG